MAVESIEHPEHYVCVDCKGAATRAEALERALRQLCDDVHDLTSFEDELQGIALAKAVLGENIYP